MKGRGGDRATTRHEAVTAHHSAQAHDGGCSICAPPINQPTSTTHVPSAGPTLHDPAPTLAAGQIDEGASALAATVLADTTRAPGPVVVMGAVADAARPSPPRGAGLVW